MSFAHPWILILLGFLPLAAWWRAQTGRQAAFVYSSLGLIKSVSDLSGTSSGKALLFMRWLAVALFILGLARPQFTESETSIAASGIDIVVALDLSGSMESEDFRLKGEQVNRLVVAKDVLQKFIDRRPSDRIGLVAFAGRAYIASPLTLDHDFLLTNLERLQLHSIEDGTAIGSALTAAINRLRDIKSKSKIVILMTDGQNNAGKVPPLTAAEAAKALEVKVYTIGVGTRGTAPMPQIVFGRKVYQQVKVDIDEDTLKAIADATGGHYYRADNTDTLGSIYDEIDRMERTEAEVKKYVQIEELYPWVVYPGFVLLLLEILLTHTLWRRLP